jgi:anti-anti-sigma regulatory factor
MVTLAGGWMTGPTSVDALRPGDHACVTFSDPDERLDIVAAFVSDGLERGDQVICFTDSLTPDVLSGQLTERGIELDTPLRHGQLRVLTSDESWLLDGAVSARRMVDLLGGYVADAAAEEYQGLRVTADMHWVTRPLVGVEQLLTFEREIASLFTDGRFTAICEYDRNSFDPVTLAFAAEAHTRTVAAAIYHEDPVLRICRQYRPPGLRLAGEIDYTRLDVMLEALGEAVRLDHDIALNLIHLRFMDAAVAGAIVRAAAALGGGRRILVRCGPVIDRVLRLAGADDVIQLRVLAAHGAG